MKRLCNYLLSIFPSHADMINTRPKKKNLTKNSNIANGQD